MAMTEFALGDPLAVQRWSTSLAVEAAKKSYFSKFIGTGTDSLIVLKNELHKGAGEKVTFGLRMKLVEYGIEGDNVIEGHATGEEALTFFNDAVFIDQLRKSTKSKGKMSEQRVPYNMRKEGRDALSTWWAEEMDEEFFCYLSGARGVGAMHNAFAAGAGNARANNDLLPPDASHQMYSGDATAKNDLDSADTIALIDLEKLVAYSEITDPMIQPFMIEGEKKFVLLIHTIQAFKLRTSTTENDWMDIHKATDRGKTSLMYKNALGEYADVILHKHRNCITFSDYGVGTDQPAARSLFLGAQAGVIAYGQNSTPNRYNWHEEADDRGNALAITAGCIFGIKKVRFNSKDFGVIALDSYQPAVA
jgi:N4-gp56 family major capsid protein